MVICSGSLPPILGVFATLAQMEPFFYILEEYLPSVYDRSNLVIVASWITRYILSLICLVDFLRFGTVMIMVVVLQTFLFISVAKSCQQLESITSLRFYTKLRLLYMNVVEVCNIKVCALMLFGQTFIVAGLWILIQCWEFISTVILFSLALITMYAVAFSALLIPAAADIQTQTDLLISRKVELYYGSARKSRGYDNFVRWRAQQCIYVFCGPFFVMRKGVTMTYFYSLVDNLITFVLLFDATTFWTQIWEIKMQSIKWQN